jgi:hypothetical protein
MVQSKEDFLTKLDAPLHDLLEQGELDSTATIPVIVRCGKESLSQVSATVASLGGRVRHQFTILGGLSAWVPLGGIKALANGKAVTSLEFERAFEIA